MATVTLVCKQCENDFIVPYKLRAKRTFCSRDCYVKGSGGANNPAFGRTYRTKETHPEWAAKTSETSKARRINAGDKNGMKQPNARLKASATRKRKFIEDPKFAAQHAAMMRNAWAVGKFDGVAVGRCKWYDHVRPDGSTVKLQGTWEVALARRLDELGVAYDAHVGRWRYTDLEGNDRSYYPDFYVPMWDVTIDIKGVFWGDCGSEKFDAVREWNPDRELIVATRDVLESWGVDLLGVQKELL